MKLSRFTDMAKDAIDKRGGPEAVKRDLMEAKAAASRQGSFKDKARAAAQALKRPTHEQSPSPASRHDAPGV